MKDLEKYFEAARKAEPVQSLQEVKSILNRHVKPAQAPFLFHVDDLFYKRKSFIYLSLTLSTMLLTLIISLITFQTPQPVQQEVYIPDSQQRLVRLVKALSIDTTMAALKVSLINNALDNTKAKSIPIHLRTYLNIPKQTLSLLGITVTDSWIKYEGNVKGAGFVNFTVNSRRHSTTVDNNQRIGVKEYDFYPWFLTDENGKQRVRFQFDNEPMLKMTNEFFANTMDQLIPIKIASPDGGNVIFWFSQTDALMQILESAANMPSQPIAAEEHDANVSSLKIEVYPTITTGDVTVRAKISEQQKLEITVLDGSGETIQVPVKNQPVSEGDHSFQMDLSELQKGLYFIRIQSKPGVTTVHRIFKN